MTQTNPKKTNLTAKTGMNKPELVRLNRFLAMAGIGSRRRCDQYISEGLVSVNGEVVDQLGVRIDPEKDVVKFDGEIIEHQNDQIYILLHKPARTVTTAKDDRKRKTVLDLIATPQRLFPVGRLDFNTTGALLITNDGDLAYHLIHPKFEVTKIYRVLLDSVIKPIDLHHFQNGLMLDDKKTAPCKATELRRMGNCSYMEVELHEGRNRQIRRMFEQLGYKVEELHRINFAGLLVSDLKPGEWRELTKEEVHRLRKTVAEYKRQLMEE